MKYKWIIEVGNDEKLIEFVADNNEDFLEKLKYGMILHKCDFLNDEIKILKKEKVGR